MSPTAYTPSPGTAADDVGDHAGPARLVGRAEAGAVVAVEVLVEDEVVLPRRVVLQPLDAAEARPPTVGPAQRTAQMRRARRSSAISSRLSVVPAAGRVLDAEVVAEEPVVALEGADQRGS